MKKEDILGRWLIVDWRQEYDDGRVTYPLGQHLRGFIEYGEHGMFCVIEKTERPRLAASQWTASEPDKAAAYSTYFSYAGGWKVDGESEAGTIIAHHVEHSLYPNWEGGIQRRTAQMRDGQLYLSARFEEGTSEARSAHLVWRKAPLSPT